MKNFILLVCMPSIVLGSCYVNFTPVVQEYDKIPMTRNHNVCKQLTDSVILYAIFVDADIYHPWTEFDIQGALDSIHKGTDWLENQASQFDKSLKVKVIAHKQGAKQTIYEKRAKASLTLNGIMALKKRHYRKLMPWADAISQYAGRGLRYKSSSKVQQRLKIENTETLNLALRDSYMCENIAIMFFVNGYYENHPSYSFYTETNTQQVEYSIVTNKNPAVITHEFMHLFGAVDLYPNFNYPNFNYPELEQKHPNDIMNIQHKEITKLNISPITSYFIGWQDTLDKANTRLLLHKNVLQNY
ncbi:MAG: hypothetical protein AB8B56_20650 [Crocinitomicaceae bacterium]